MVLTRFDDSGAEEWSCLQCGRRMLLRWPPPSFEALVLDEGDPRVPHAGTKGDAALSAEAGADVRNDGVTTAELRWLREHGIAWDGRAK